MKLINGGYRALQIGLSVILQNSADFEVNGPLEYAGMPEMGITSCPLRIIPRSDVGSRNSMSTAGP